MIKPQKKDEIIDFNDFHFLSKTISDGDCINKGICVEDHCKIAGYVAEEIIKMYPCFLKDILFTENTPLIAACHDVGKISPSFQKMIYSSINSDEAKNISVLKNVSAELAKRKEIAFHGKVSQTALNDKSKYIQIITAMHHGFRPNPTFVEEDRFGGKQWTEKRHELISIMERCFTNDRQWPDLNNWQNACAVGGLVIVADWIASGGFFSTLTYEDKFSEQQIRDWAKDAVFNAGFRQLKIKKNLSFKNIFSFEMRSVQKDFVDSVENPGVYILEAPMGYGKTEAALYAAYKMLASGKSNGIYFALPTQLTSNKIYERVESFLSIILEENGEKLKLLHSSAWLENKMGEDGDVGRSWFDGSKRGILAPFAVGTIDQALMSVINVKHSFVRSFGLAGKVVILDEVHSYDSYTGSLMNELVDCLQKNGCTVILLSATLTAEQKQKLLKVYDYSFKNSYPLITCRKSSVVKSQNVNKSDLIEIEAITQFEEKTSDSHDVQIEFQRDTEEAVKLALEKAETGEQVLWIENTVDDAQKIYSCIKARINRNIEIGLIHSRFIKNQRSINEEYWVNIYGSSGTEKRTQKGRILIGTQVLEQSLDIDADFLITKICPTDMLLQRIGRLWRHKKNNTKRPENAVCQTLILSPEYSLNDANIFDMTGFVYDKYVLFRTLEVWKNLANVTLPDDIRPLLEKTYKDRDEQDFLNKLKDEMIAERNKLESFARITKVYDDLYNPTYEENNVKTRYSEEETCSVLLLKEFHKKDGLCTLKFLDNSIIHFQNNKNLHYKEKIAISKAILENSVTVAVKHAPAYDRTIELLKDFVYTGNSDDAYRPFRYAIVNDDFYLQDVFKNRFRNEVKHGFELYCYDKTKGYQIIKEEH